MAAIISFLVHFFMGAAIFTFGYCFGRKEGKEDARVMILYDLKAKVEKSAMIALGATVTEIRFDPLNPENIHIEGIIRETVKEFNEGGSDESEADKGPDADAPGR